MRKIHLHLFQKKIDNQALVNIDIAYVSLLVITLFLSNIIKNVKMLENSSALKPLVVKMFLRKSELSKRITYENSLTQ